MKIAPGSRITLHLSIALSDGMVVESTFDDEPISLTVGDGTLDEGLELALTGLMTGEVQTLTLMPGQAFGLPDPQAIQQMPLTAFSDSMSIEVGSVVGFSGPDNLETAGTVTAINNGIAEVDFNHPLAGHEIVFKAEILAVENPGL